MYTSKDRMMLEHAYRATKQINEFHLGGGMSSVPVMVTMDMPGATTSAEDHIEGADEGEVSMAASDLDKIADLSAKLQQIVGSNPALEGWVSAKITKAADYISSVYDYMNAESDSDCGCDHGHEHDEHEMFDAGYEDTEEFCIPGAMGCKCGGCPSCH